MINSKREHTMKKILLLTLLWAVMPAVYALLYAQSRTVHVTNAGTFYQHIPENERYSITQLTVSGDLNGDDIKIIREMAGCDFMTKDKYSLRTLDLSDANIVQGGGSYYNKTDGSAYYTSVNQIGELMFTATDLYSIKLPNSVFAIGFSAFSSSDSLTEILLPEGLSTIDMMAFAFCPKLKSINVPSTVTRIESYAFENCISLQSIKLPEKLSSLGFLAFRNCKSLDSIKIPKGIGHVSSSLCLGCINLSKVILHENIRSIEDKAFQNCHKLSRVDLPASLATIRERAFENCVSLKEIFIQAKEPPVCKELAFSGVPKSCILHIPKGTTDAYSKANEWKNFTLKEEAYTPDAAATIGHPVRVWGVEGGLFINTEAPEQVKVFAMSGALIKEINISAGLQRINLSKGAYVILLGDTSYKVVVE